MRTAFDPAKDRLNTEKHGVSLRAAVAFEWEAALVRADVRFAYPEPRLIAMAPINDRLFVLVFTVDRRVLRLISLRKANRKEFDLYVTQS